MSEEETLSSMEAPKEVHDLVSALHPWPTSNERAYWIVNEHMKELRLQKRATGLALNVWEHLGKAALEALHEVIDRLGPHWVRAFPETVVLDVQYAFRKEKEVCGEDSSSDSSPQPKKSA